jgi:hypothetical protein
MRKPAKVALLSLLSVLWAVWSPAADPTAAHSPYQGEIAFQLGQPLDPGVNIDGVIWSDVQVTPKGKLTSGRPVKTEVVLGFKNTSPQDVRILVILLFEDEQGEALDRVEIKPASLSAGKARRFKQRLKIQSDVLSSARKLYLFCEVQPR